MRSMVAKAIDAREECDLSVTAKHSGISSTDHKARFMIRTLPRDCNPTPATGVTSPRGRKSLSSVQENDEPAISNPFDDITENKLVGIFRIYLT